MLAAGSFAVGDPMVAAGYFSRTYHMVVNPPVLLHVPRTDPIILHSPRNSGGIIQLRNFIKRTILRRLVERERLVNKRERLVEKREDRVERYDQRVEQREILADEKAAANQATALDLELERKKIQEEKEQHSLALQQQDRKKFDEDQKAAIVAMEEQRRKLEEHKVKVSQGAAEQGLGEEPKGQAAKEQDKGQSALIVRKVETADSRLGLMEKIIDIPKRKQAITKSIKGNFDIVKNAPFVKNHVTPYTKRIKSAITAAATTGLLGCLRVELRDLLGFPAGVLNGGPKNGTGHEAASASTRAGTGHEAASASTGSAAGHEAATGAGAGAGHEAASASRGAGAGDEAASTGGRSGVKAV